VRLFSLLDAGSLEEDEFVAVMRDAPDPDLEAWLDATFAGAPETRV
jgi:hypothetical protein